ncbi:MAG TPA: prephenate dehydratase domain-containing protein [Phycisphaerae bacterium]|nr:prephenate dehydratase domain-containing protein [Phycisphaerae bacterium]
MCLENLWKNVREIDAQLVELFNDRARVASEIRKLLQRMEQTRENGELPSDRAVDYRQIAMETLEHAAESNRGELADADLRRIFREILAVYRQFIQPRRYTTACLGPLGTHSHLAASKCFGEDCVYVFVEDELEMLRKVTAGEVDYGVIAIGNSVGGYKGETIDLLAERVGVGWGSDDDKAVRICGEASIKVDHFLLGRGSLEAVREIYSHSQAFIQCRNQLRRLKTQVGFRDLKLVAERSTAEAAHKAALDRSGTVAAIANRLAADLWQLRILREHMEDDSSNTTRFVVVGRECRAPTGRDRTSMWFRVSGSRKFLDALLAFRDLGVSISQIVSRPVADEVWAQSFFVEAEGHVDDEPVKRAVEKMQECCKRDHLKILGSYPRTVETYLSG